MAFQSKHIKLFKMANIFDEFRLLSDSETITRAIDLLESGLLPESEAKVLAMQIWKALIPPTPQGMSHVKESIWAQGSTRFVWKGLIGVQPDRHAAWLREQRMRKPRTTIFSPMYALPQVRDGKV